MRKFMHYDIIQLIDRIEKILAPLEDKMLSESVMTAKENLNSEQIPSALLVSFSLDMWRLLIIASQVCGWHPEENLKNFFRHTVFLSLEYDDEVQLYHRIDGTAEPVGNKTDEPELLLTLPCSFLKKSRLLLCGNPDAVSDWKTILSQQDAVCLITNAVAAMNLYEKNWIAQTWLPFADQESSMIYIAELDKLNADEEDEARQVSDSVRNTVKRIHVKLQIAEKIQQIPDFLHQVFRQEEETLRVRRSQHILKNCLAEIDRRLAELCKIKNEDIHQLEEAVKQFSAVQEKIKTAGQVAADIVLCNAFVEIRSNLLESIRAYNSDMKKHIREKIISCSNEELDDIAETLTKYIRVCWGYYIAEADRIIAENIEQTMEMLIKQFDQDIARMYADVDKTTLNVIENMPPAVLLHQTEKYWITDEVQWIRTKESPVERLRKNTRNILLLSVPCIIVNPAFGAAVFAGVSLFSHQYQKFAARQYRELLLKEIETVCSSYCSQIAEQMEEALKSSEEESCVNIRILYENLANYIVSGLKEKIRQQEKTARHQEIIQNIREQDMPEWNSLLKAEL